MSTPTFFKIVVSMTTIFLATTSYSQAIWNGANSTDWSDPANWSTGTVPVNSIDVEVPNTALNFPVLSERSSCRDLTINSGASLDMNGFRLTIKGSFANNGSFENSGSVAQFRLLANSGNYLLGGFSDTDIRIIKSSSGNYTVNGNIDCRSIKLNQNNSGTIIIDGQGVTVSDYFLVEGGSFNVKSGSFSALKNTSSTSNSGFNIKGGALDIEGGAVSFGLSTTPTADLNVNGGTVNISGGVLNISDELDVVNGTVSQTGGVINIRNYSGSAQGSAQPKFDMLSGTLNLINGTINLLGQHNGLGNLSMNVSSSVVVNSLASHTINIFSNNTSSDEDRYIDLGSNAIGGLSFDQSGHELYLSRDLLISGDLVVSSGTFDIESNTVNVMGSTINQGVLKIGSGTLDTQGSFDANNGLITFSAAGRLEIGGAATSFGSMTNTIGTVVYDGGSQNVLADSYFNLEVDGLAIKTLPPNSFTINGDLMLNSTELSYNSTVTNKTMSVKGNILGNGTITSTVSNILRLNGNGSNQGLRCVSSDFIGIRISGQANVITTGDISCKYLDLLTGSTGSFTIDGEVVTINPTNGYLQLDGADLSISSGELTNNSINQNNNYINAGTLSINGGIVKMTGNNGASAAGGDLNVNGGTISINGGILSINDELDVANGIINQTGGEIYIKANSNVNWMGTQDNKFDMDAGTLNLSGGVLYVQAQANSSFNSIDISNNVNATISATHTISVFQSNPLFADDCYLSFNGHAIGNLTVNLNGKTTFFRETPLIQGDLVISDGILDFENFNVALNGNCSVSGILKLGVGNYDFNGAIDASLGAIDFSDDGKLFVSTDNPVFGNLDAVLGEVVFDGTALQNISEALNFSSFTIENPNGVSLSSSIEVTNNFMLNSGIVSVSSPNSVKLLSSCQISGSPDENTHINGLLLRETVSDLDYLFPVGDGFFYRPVVLNPEGALLTTYSVEFINTPHSSISYDVSGNNITPCGADLDHVAMGSWWDISRVQGTQNCHVGINWGVSSGVDNPDDIRLSHWNGIEWENIGQVISGDDGVGLGSATSGRVRSDNYVSNFSPFNLGSGNGNNPLPIDLLSFHTDCSHDIVDVNFSVLSQVNNDYFLIERSEDAIDWEVVGQLDGVEGGNNNTQMDYVFVDNSPLLNLSYYRLTQVDFDGKSKTYYPVSTTCGGSSEGGLPVAVYPNPALNQVNIEMDLNDYQGGEVYYTIIDIAGKAILSDYIQLHKGFNKQTININDLTKGVYILRFHQTKDTILDTRIIKR